MFYFIIKKIILFTKSVQLFSIFTSVQATIDFLTQQNSCMQNIEVLNILLCEQDLVNKQGIIDDFCKEGYVPVQCLREGNDFEQIKKKAAKDIEGELLEIAQFIRFPVAYCA